MLAIAQHAMADELRPAKRQRQRSLREYVGPSGGHVLLGVRISVYWPDDDAFYKVRPSLPPVFACRTWLHLTIVSWHLFESHCPGCGERCSAHVAMQEVSFTCRGASWR